MLGRRKATTSKEAGDEAVRKEGLKDAMKIFQFIKPYRWTFAFGMFLLFLSSMVFMIFPSIIGLMFDVAQGVSTYDFSLQDIKWLILVVLLAQGLVSYVRVLIFAYVSEKSIADVRKALYQKLIALPIPFFEESKTGDLISRLTADVEKLYSTFSITLAEFLRQIIILIAGILFLFITMPKLTAIMLLTVIPVVTITALFFGRFVRKQSQKRQDKMAISNSLLGDSIQGIQIIKAFVSEVLELKRYNKSVDNMVGVAMTFAHYRAIFATIIITVMFGGLFFIMWSAAVMLENGDITGGELVSFVTYSIIIAASIASLGNFYSDLLGAIGATERVREILDQKSEVAIDVEKEVDPLKIYGDIQFKDVRFTYPTRTDIEVLKGINIDIKAGQKVALVGQSGSGKSTIIQLLLRFYNITQGDIKVDGKSIFDKEIRAYRNTIAFVPQEVILFGGTIKENILYGKENASDAEIIDAAKQSNSWEFIQKFPEGLDTLIGERGVKLSGGQRQRIAIARAILKNPSILLLDEATSALDTESEKVVQDALDKLMVGRTSIIIAHRLSTIKDVDCIYVLSDGQIVEEGTHHNLIEKIDGLYSNQAKLGGL